MLQLIQDNFLVLLVLGIVMYVFVCSVTYCSRTIWWYFTLLALAGVLYSFEVGSGVALWRASSDIIRCCF